MVSCGEHLRILRRELQRLQIDLDGLVVGGQGDESLELGASGFRKISVGIEDFGFGAQGLDFGARGFRI